MTHEPTGPAPEEVAGQELRQLRIDRGWSQEDVARRMNAYGYEWHQTLVARIEAAQRPLRLNEAVALAALYDVALERLLRPPGDDMSADQIDESIGEAAARLEAATRRYDEVQMRWDQMTAALVPLGEERSSAQADMAVARKDLARLRGLREQALGGKGSG